MSCVVLLLPTDVYIPFLLAGEEGKTIISVDLINEEANSWGVHDLQSPFLRPCDPH